MNVAARAARRAARQAARVCGGIRIPPLGRLGSAVKRRIPSKSSAQRWRVTVIGGSRAREITELEATSAEAAIKRAIREHGIDDPHKQKRLAAYGWVKPDGTIWFRD